MTDLELLFLFDEPLAGWEMKSLDTWIGGSPWAHKPGTWTMWALSYGPMPDRTVVVHPELEAVHG